MTRDPRGDHRSADQRGDEQKHLSVALEAAELGTWRLDLKTRIITLDLRAQRHYSLGPGPHSIEAISAVIHPDDRDRLSDEMATVLRTPGQDSYATEYRVLDGAGGVRQLRVFVRLEFEALDAIRRPVVAFGTTQDITAARATERRLLEQALLLREVGQIAKVGGWEFDPETGHGEWTEETWRIHGLSEAPTFGSEGLDRFEGEARVTIEAALAAALRDGTPYDLELPFVAADGVRKWVRAVCRPVVEDGRVVRLRGTLQDITAQRNSVQALDRFMRASPSIIYALEVEAEAQRLVWVGGDLERLTGWKPHEVNATSWWRDNIHPEDRARVLANNPAPYEIDHLTIDFRFRRADGTYLWVHDERRLLRDAQGRPREVVGSWSDVTSLVDLQERLRQAHKLEAIGLLAGGIAHDFNNLLTVLIGSSEVLAAELPADSDLQQLVGDIRFASDRAAALTRQLLVFSRKQVLQPAVIDVNTAIEALIKMLTRLIGEDVMIDCRLGPQAGRITIDPGQFEQVILNVAVNARDAMPRGGTLTLRTDAVGPEAVPGEALEPAPTSAFTRLTIEDTGVGMSPEILSHVFEPFFTTKPAGRGTGLGLATVFGIVKQSGGHIAVASTPGAGTRFTLLFPRVDEAASATRQSGRLVHGHETILVVDDDASVRRVAAAALGRYGYRVTSVEGPVEALEYARGDAAIDLLLTDVVMPGLSGPDLARAVQQHRPHLKVLFMSGYVQDTLERQGLSGSSHAFLFKPFSLEELASRVRLVLDQR